MEQSIKIRIADREYPLKVSSPDKEEIIRKATSELNKKINLYQEKYPNKGMIEILSFVALNVSMANVALQNRTEAMVEEEGSLARELQNYLDNIDKKSR